MDIKSILYSKEMSPLEFNFELLSSPSMYNWLNPYDIDGLYNIATSIKHSANIRLKKQAIDDIMTKRGCKKIGGGTNRVVYAPLECKTNCFKIALDRVGIHDNPSEYQNQFLLKPFITKMFEHDQSGVIANVERVKAVTSKESYISIAPDIYELLTNRILGKYVLEDIGTNYMFNYGVRVGFGAVLLDYPMVFELDGSKMYCNNLLPDGTFCGGEIDYDDGFNHLYCMKCGKHYQARQLTSNIKNKTIKISKEDIDMDLKSQLIINGKVVSESNSGTETIQDSEYAGKIRTRKVRMTEKEIKRMQNEQRRKEKFERKQQEQKQAVVEHVEEPTAYLKDVTPNTIADAITSIKNTAEDAIIVNNNIERAVQEESVDPFDVSKLQEALGCEDNDQMEFDYSTFGLEPVTEEESVEEPEQTEFHEEVETFEPIKKKKTSKFDNL